MILRIDGHVHLHPCFDPLKALAQLSEALTGESVQAVALLTEREGEHLLRGWCEGALPAGVRGEVCGDAVSMRVRVGRSAPLLLVPGRQLVTTDGLEVLALCADLEVPDRMPLVETIDWADAQGALVVLPWGLGKWTGGRGGLLKRTLADSRGGVLLGDSTMRPDHCPGERIMHEAEAGGIQVLPGSDALPVGGEERRGGSYYAEVAYAGPLVDPTRELRELLSRGKALQRGGGRPGWGQVLRRQVAYEIRRRLGR
jgi:hypothetical protein